MNTIIRDKTGNPEAVIRELGNGSRVLCDLGGNRIATYLASQDATLDNSGNVIAFHDRLLSLLPPR